jgi:predicted protein tyrosine phosphatase
MDQVVFVPRAIAQSMLPPPGSAMISISSSDEPLAEFQPGWEEMLRLRFDDIDTPRSGLTLFGPDHAWEIFQFIEDLVVDPQIRQLYVHCTMGVSRSAAVALFAAEHLGCPCFCQATKVSTQTWPHYNRRVLRLLQAEAAGERLEDLQSIYEGIFST